MYFCFGLLGYTISIVSHICIAHIYIYTNIWATWLYICFLQNTEFLLHMRAKLFTDPQEETVDEFYYSGFIDK